MITIYPLPLYLCYKKSLIVQTLKLLYAKIKLHINKHIQATLQQNMNNEKSFKEDIMDKFCLIVETGLRCLICGGPVCIKGK